MDKKAKNLDVIKIEIPKTLKTEVYAKIKNKYGDITTDTINNVFLDIFEQWIIQTDIDDNIEHSTQPDLDAHSTDEEDNDVFCAPADVFPDTPAVLNTDTSVPTVEWNGNHTMNIIRARAQACFLLNPHDYSGLSRRVMDGILSIVENKKNIVEVKENDKFG